eukprot:SAG22_NODE_1417_length_4469_cov_2.981465_4_plen_347_part_00
MPPPVVTRTVAGLVELALPLPEGTRAGVLDLDVSAGAVRVSVDGALWWSSPPLPTPVDPGSCKAKLQRAPPALRIRLAPAAAASASAGGGRPPVEAAAHPAAAAVPAAVPAPAAPAAPAPAPAERRQNMGQTVVLQAPACVGRPAAGGGTAAETRLPPRPELAEIAGALCSAGYAVVENFLDEYMVAAARQVRVGRHCLSAVLPLELCCLRQSVPFRAVLLGPVLQEVDLNGAHFEPGRIGVHTGTAKEADGSHQTARGLRGDTVLWVDDEVRKSPRSTQTEKGSDHCLSFCFSAVPCGSTQCADPLWGTSYAVAPVPAIYLTAACLSRCCLLDHKRAWPPTPGRR